MDPNVTVPGGAAAPSYVFAVWNLVIRPPRSCYELSELGPAEFKVCGIRCTRRDLRVRASRGQWLECSHFTPWQQGSREMRKMPVVVFLHGNSSSRLQALNLVEPFLRRSISLFCYDAAGCGRSEGDYVSLGWHERDDLACVVEHLRSSPFCGPIGLCGRSMGAVTALMHAHRDPSLGAVLVDSPFSSLRTLIQELVPDTLPTWLLESAIYVIRNRVKTLAGFDIEDVVPLDTMDRLFVPSLFVHGRDDDFITPAHSQQLFNACSGDKEYLLVAGDHNSRRTRRAIDAFVQFFCRAFQHHEMDMTVAPHMVDAELAVPQLDGLPHRVPCMPEPSSSSTPHPSVSPELARRSSSGPRVGFTCPRENHRAKKTWRRDASPSNIGGSVASLGGA